MKKNHIHFISIKKYIYFQLRATSSNQICEAVDKKWRYAIKPTVPALPSPGFIYL